MGDTVTANRSSSQGQWTMNESKQAIDWEDTDLGTERTIDRRKSRQRWAATYTHTDRKRNRTKHTWPADHQKL